MSVVKNDRWDGQTDGRTDARPFHRPCYAYYAEYQQEMCYHCISTAVCAASSAGAYVSALPGRAGQNAARFGRDHHRRRSDVVTRRQTPVIYGSGRGARHLQARGVRQMPGFSNGAFHDVIVYHWPAAATRHCTAGHGFISATQPNPHPTQPQPSTVTQPNSLSTLDKQCSKIRILRFFRFKKRDFLRFFEMTCQKVVSKSFVLNPSKWVHILRSVITVIHLSYLFVSLVYLRTYRHLSQTVLSCIVACECEHYVRISEQRCLMLGTYRYWLFVIVY